MNTETFKIIDLSGSVYKRAYLSVLPSDPNKIGTSKLKTVLKGKLLGTSDQHIVCTPIYKLHKRNNYKKVKLKLKG